MKVYLYDSETISMADYQELLDLYHKQVTKNANLQDVITDLRNEIFSLEAHIAEVEQVVDICLEYQKNETEK